MTQCWPGSLWLVPHNLSRQQCGKAPGLNSVRQKTYRFRNITSNYPHFCLRVVTCYVLFKEVFGEEEVDGEFKLHEVQFGFAR